MTDSRVTKSAVLAAAICCVGCGDARERIATRTLPVVCSGQSDKLIATDYVGPKEEVTSAGVEGVGHAADAVGVQADPMRFAVAYSSTSSNVKVKIYDADSGSVAATGTLPYPSDSTRKWVRRLGYDATCTASGLSASECAWFTWDDRWDDVNWVAVDKNGNRGTVRYQDGHDSSGQVGSQTVCIYAYCVTYYKKLLAYITVDRSAVRGKFLNQDGSVASDFLITQMASGWKAWQTAVSYSRNEERWLVAWTEQPPTTSSSHRVRNRYVTYGGTLGTNNLVSYCDSTSGICGITRPFPTDGGVADGGVEPSSESPEGDGGPKDEKDPSLAAPTKADGQQNTWMYNPGCVCKGIWLASSWYGSSYDRYRLHEYTTTAVLRSSGVVYTQGSAWSAYRPVTQHYGGATKPFAQLINFATGDAREDVFTLGSATPTSGGVVFTTYGDFPQAYRNSDFGVAASLSTSQTTNNLALSLSTSSASGSAACP